MLWPTWACGPVRGIRSASEEQRRCVAAGRAFNGVPERRGSGERRIEDALEALACGLSAAGAPWMIVGGIAVIARGVRRLTTDIDAVVRGDATDPMRLLASLVKERIVPRIEDATAFAEQNLVLLLRHEPTGVDLDVSFGWSGFERKALEARAEVRFGRVSAPMATPEDLVVFKALAARPKDIEDAEALLLLHPSIDLRRVRRHVRELADLAGEEGLAEQLERVIRRVRRARRSRA